MAKMSQQIHTATIEIDPLEPVQKRVLATYLFELNGWQTRINNLKYRLVRRGVLTPEEEGAFGREGVLQIFVVGTRTHTTLEAALADPRQFDVVVRSTCRPLVLRLVDDIQKDIRAVTSNDVTKFSRPTRRVDVPRGWRNRDADAGLPLTAETISRLEWEATTPGQKAWVRRNPGKPRPIRIIYGLFAPRTYAVIGMDLPAVQRLVLRMQKLFAPKKKAKKAKPVLKLAETYWSVGKTRLANSVASSLAASVRR